MTSLRETLASINGCTKKGRYPGHGQITDIGSEKIRSRYITVNDGEWEIR